MSIDKSRRGRPKGTGIDDTPVLEDIASLIAANSDMRPTTAIKALGIADPSTIRRLRDKYKEFAEARHSYPARATQSRSQPNFRDDSQRESRAIALVTARDRTISEVVTEKVQVREPEANSLAKANRQDENADDPSAKQVKTCVAHPEASSGENNTKKRAPKKLEPVRCQPTPFDVNNPTPFTAWMLAWRQGLKACQDAANLQRAVTRELVNAPATQMFIRQQIAMSQMMLAMMPPAGLYPDTAAILAGFPKR